MTRSEERTRAEDGDGYPRLLSARIGFLLARAHLIAREKADRALEDVGLTMKAYAALATLVSDGPVSQQKLSRRIRMDPATMVDVIDTLEGSGHIIRRRNPESISLARYSSIGIVPDRQPAHASRFFLMTGSRVSSSTMSATANRPPGRSTRNASLITAPLSSARLMTQFEITTSTEASGSG